MPEAMELPQGMTIRGEARLNARAISSILYKTAPKIKLGKTDFENILEMAYYLAYSNCGKELCHRLKQDLKENERNYDICVGEVETVTLGSWNELSKHKLGSQLFSAMTVEDFMENKNMNNFVRKNKNARFR